VISVPLLVQKFGGTSVADPDKILAAASRAIRAHRMGARVVVVVSARGHTTDELIAAARQLTMRPPAREMDMLLSTGEQVSIALMAIAIQALGVPAISFTGSQIGLVTDRNHTKARIRDISTERIMQALDDGKIVIVAGFQGVDEHFNITTFGRGGSDTTAVALAAVMGADACEIYTDVEGIYTTDPRIVPEARKLDRISYDEMLELASLGAGVMHSRSIEFAKKHGVPIHVRTSASDALGTWIVADVDARRLGVSVVGTALARDEARVTVAGVPDRTEAVHELFRRVAQANIVVDMIVQNIATAGSTRVSFTVPADDLAETRLVAEDAARAIGASGVTDDANVSKVSVVGLGMRFHAGVAAVMFESLARAEINVQMITTGDIKISVLVDRSLGEAALRAVHRAFELDRPPVDGPAPAVTRRPAGLNLVGPTNAGHPQAMPVGMEDLMITGVELDDAQSRVTVLGVPDRPGEASRIFRLVAEAGVLVDMIVQNVGSKESPNLTFTVPRRDVDRVAAVLAVPLGEGRVAVDRDVAKLSLTGVGMRTNAGVAARMFGVLAERGIGPIVINTSEVRINVAVPLERGREGLECLRVAFQLDADDEGANHPTLRLESHDT
jgi:aspartate kinase